MSTRVVESHDETTIVQLRDSLKEKIVMPLAADGDCERRFKDDRKIVVSTRDRHRLHFAVLSRRARRRYLDRSGRVGECLAHRLRPLTIESLKMSMVSSQLVSCRLTVDS